MKVLIVEDDRSLAEIIERNLLARGHTTTIAGSAEDAVLRVMEDWPDVMITDVNLPDYSSWEILRRLGPVARARVRVIVISAVPISPKRIQEFRPAGALQKPFPIGALMHAVEGDAVGAVAAG